MRKPLNQNEFRSTNPSPVSQPMLKRRQRFRYDAPPVQEPSRTSSVRIPVSEAQEFDMDVTAAHSIGGTAPIRPAQMAPTPGAQPVSAGGLVAPQDEVQISSAASALGQIDPGMQIHEARLAEIRAAIADGSYETPEKLDVAVDRLLAALTASPKFSPGNLPVDDA